MTKTGLVNSGLGALCWVSGLDVNGSCDQAGQIQAPKSPKRTTSRRMRFIKKYYYSKAVGDGQKISARDAAIFEGGKGYYAVFK